MSRDHTPSTGLWCSTEQRQAEAVALAARYQLPLLPAAPASGFALELAADRLQLCEYGLQTPGPVWVDFAGGASRHRRQHGGGRGQPVAKAVGLKGGANPTVLDATAGLGGDSFVLASLGCRVWLVERSPVAAALLADGLARAAQDADAAAIVERMQLLHDDAVAVLGGWREAAPDVVFLDPMFPEKNKSAAAKKTMRAFQLLIGGDLDADALLQPARRLARQKVVVKRPKQAPWLAGEKPHLSLGGESTRFDVYLPLA